MSEKIPIHNIDGVSICIKHDGRWKIEGYEKSFTEDQCERIVFGFSREKELSQKLAEREEELREALEVIKFYADKDNWKNMEHCQGDKVSRVRIEAQDYYEDNTISDKKYLNLIGGKRAREFLKKIGKVR